MLIRPNGHAQFLLQNSEGAAILTDPFDEGCGYPYEKCIADVVTVSHGHHDHADLGKCEAADGGKPIVIEGAGRRSPLPDVVIEGIEVFHDDCQGQKRGKNVMMLIETEGLRLLHAGDLGHTLSDETLLRCGRVDILFLPVGGFFTLSPAEAAQTCAALKPRIVIPMHYKTAYTASWPIEGVEPFLDLMGATRAERTPMSILRVTKGDLSEQKRICVLEIDGSRR